MTASGGQGRVQLYYVLFNTYIYYLKVKSLEFEGCPNKTDISYICYVNYNV